MNRIVLTGGGTAGHVTPNLALIPELKKQGWEIHYVGTEKGIEKQLISGVEGVTYHSVKTGKLRRYFDLKNLTDPFRVIAGVGQSVALISKLKPRIIFSKGGFVSVPVVIGGWLNRVPVIVHESDITPGLANKIATRFAKYVCATFPETVNHFKSGKAVHTGTPIRPELFKGVRERGLSLCGFKDDKPVILVMGGSQGSVAINKAIQENLPRLSRRFYIAHICGKNNINEALIGHPDYMQFEYVDAELPHLMAIADLVVSRAGANSIFEFLALKIPALLIPLPLNASRGDQILNARSFEKQGFAKVLMQEDLTDQTLYESIMSLHLNRGKYVEAMNNSNIGSGTEIILELINKAAK
ncbi:MAG TPA: undecaprenyldiphospho-muramoylpentapeptide beta-N-acetylglucosaminyltransferase [Candidatus Atribacteria bacterium]|nr:undecaprenyldiphospho-muramoylpentapeptide beta-N-acetylglucosaminyltransferase [Candidatus Atribacteria bacterium]